MFIYIPKRLYVHLLFFTHSPISHLALQLILPICHILLRASVLYRAAPNLSTSILRIYIYMYSYHEIITRKDISKVYLQTI